MPEKSPNNVSLVNALGRAIRDSKAPWVVLAIIALALILSGCAVDTSKVQRTRADLEVLCKGAITNALKLACARAGVSTEGEPVSAP